MSFMDINRQSHALHQDPVTVTIALNAAVSSQVEIGNRYARGVAVMLVGTAWTAANFALEVSMDGGTSGTWTPVFDETGTRVMITNVSTTARRLYIFPAAAWAVMRYRYLRIASVNTSTYANVNQGGPRALEVSILS